MGDVNQTSRDNENRYLDYDWAASYKIIIDDIANSGTYYEAQQKESIYAKQLAAFKDSGINVNNDLTYIYNNLEKTKLTGISLGIPEYAPVPAEAVKDTGLAIDNTKPDAVAERIPGIGLGDSLYNFVANNPKFQAVTDALTKSQSLGTEFNWSYNFNWQAPIKVRAIIGGYKEVDATIVEDRLFADHRYDGLSPDRAKTLGQYDFSYNLNDKLYYGAKFLGEGLAERVGAYRDRLQNNMQTRGIPENWAQAGADVMTGELLGAGILSGIKSGSAISNLARRSTQESSKAAPEAAESSFKFTQATASARFSNEGIFSGKTIGEVANDLRAGVLKASDVPVEYIERDGIKLIVNTRSSLALKRAGVLESEWNLINKTGDQLTEATITKRLAKNKLTDEGADVLRITGPAKNASNLE